MEQNKRFTGAYISWQSMKQRCNNTNRTGYKNYGGRGISYTAAWNDFEVFLRDMGDRPEGTELERIDNNEDYCPENCVWATRTEQMRNTSRTVLNELIVKTAKSLRMLHPESSQSAVASAVAKKFGVTRGSVLAALRGKSWVNVN